MSNRPICLTLCASLLTLVASVSAFGADLKYLCQQGATERAVTVSYPEAGKKAPCEVRYKRDITGDEKVLFQAKVQEGYCEQKAKDFVDKLKGMGWDCNLRQE